MESFFFLGPACREARTQGFPGQKPQPLFFPPSLDQHLSMSLLRGPPTQSFFSNAFRKIRRVPSAFPCRESDPAPEVPSLLPESRPWKDFLPMTLASVVLGIHARGFSYAGQVEVSFVFFQSPVLTPS